MMSAHRTVQQFGPSRRSPFRFAAAALCTAFVLMAASGCTPMRKQGAVPTFPASTMNDAVEAYQKGRRFSAALQQQEHPALLNGLGMAYLSCNQPRNAAQAFERAVSISPGSAALHANAGTALYADNDYESAERQFDAALRIDPTNPEALVGKAGILIQRKEPEKALRQLSLVSGTDAASPEVQGAGHVSDGAHGRRGHGSRYLCLGTPQRCRSAERPRRGDAARRELRQREGAS